jgi:hypothetical protein
MQQSAENSAIAFAVGRVMKFRFQAFGLHLLGSACLIALVLGGLYFGWYRWPGWYLAGALDIVLIMVGIDVVLGPLMTLIIANPNKPRRVLARDIGIIVAVQLVAFGYGFTTLWHGRPLYYTYSVRFLEMVQASDLSPEQVALGQQLNPRFAPHWYSLPRWIYAPLPTDDAAAAKIVGSAVTGGDDVIQMPRFYKPWSEAIPDIRKNLRVLNTMTELAPDYQGIAAARLKQLGYSADEPRLLPMVGHGKPLVAVMDPATAQIKEWIRVD